MRSYRGVTIDKVAVERFETLNEYIGEDYRLISTGRDGKDELFKVTDNEGNVIETHLTYLEAIALYGNHRYETR
jgi:hypothetical protein